VYVAEAAARSLDLFGLQTGLNRRRRCANFSLAFFDPVHFRRQTIDPFTVNCRVIRLGLHRPGEQASYLQQSPQRIPTQSAWSLGLQAEGLHISFGLYRQRSRRRTGNGRTTSGAKM
jgi:hypothetical protein